MAIQFILAGGPVIWLLVLFSIIATTIILLKVWQFWGQQLLASTNADQALRALENDSPAQAKLLLRGCRNPQSQVILYTLGLIEDGVLQLNEIRAEGWRCARAKIGKLGNSLRALEVIANLAPLLGLFGTVLGMIEAFRAMEAAGAHVDPSVLSGGIWQALLTTAVGLAVAIPVSIAHSWLERRVEVEASGMQDKLERLMTWYSSGKPLASGHSSVANQSKHA